MALTSFNTVLSPSFGLGYPDLAGPIILFENLLNFGTVTVSSELENGEKENAYGKGSVRDYWRPDGTDEQWMQVVFDLPVTVNAMGIAGHNIFQRLGQFSLEYSEDEGETWLAASPGIQPANNRPFMVLTNGIISTHFRILFEDHTGNIDIGALSIGLALQFPRGVGINYEPPQYNKNVIVENIMSENGNFLGSFERYRNDVLAANIRDLGKAFVSDRYQDFADMSMIFPFFWTSGDPDNYEVFYGKCTARPTAKYETTTTFRADIEAMGFA